jgi:hypothetical protein
VNLLLGGDGAAGAIFVWMLMTGSITVSLIFYSYFILLIVLFLCIFIYFVAYFVALILLRLFLLILFCYFCLT